ncbi:MAG: hypothetical protein WCA64_03660 [Gallionella sp.]
MTKHKISTQVPAPPETEPAKVIERPDGFYWRDKLTGKEYGPFPTLLEAEQDMEVQTESGFEEGESLEDAEEEIGISNWIDPETGEPAEGATPHLSDE